MSKTPKNRQTNMVDPQSRVQTLKSCRWGFILIWSIEKTPTQILGDASIQPKQSYIARYRRAALKGRRSYSHNTLLVPETKARCVRAYVWKPFLPSVTAVCGEATLLETRPDGDTTNSPCRHRTSRASTDRHHHSSTRGAQEPRYATIPEHTQQMKKDD